MNDNQNREKLNMQEQETITIRNLATGYKGKHKTHIVARDINASIYAGELTYLFHRHITQVALFCQHHTDDFRHIRIGIFLNLFIHDPDLSRQFR